MLKSVHRKSYKAPAVRRVWIPKPGKTEKRPIGVPCVSDRALQRSIAVILNAIYEQDFKIVHSEEDQEGVHIMHLPTLIKKSWARNKLGA